VHVRLQLYMYLHAGILVGFDSPTYLVDEGDTVDFRIVLSTSPQQPITVSFSTVEGDATGMSRQSTIPHVYMCMYIHDIYYT